MDVSQSKYAQGNRWQHVCRLFLSCMYYRISTVGSNAGIFPIDDVLQAQL
jgi:hypothetical protein